MTADELERSKVAKGVAPAADGDEEGGHAAERDELAEAHVGRVVELGSSASGVSIEMAGNSSSLNKVSPTPLAAGSGTDRGPKSTWENNFQQQQQQR